MTKIASVASGKEGVFEFKFTFSASLQKADDSSEPDLVFQVFNSTGIQMELMSIFTLAGEQETAVEKLSDSKQAPIVLMNTATNLNLRIVVDLKQRPITEFEQLIVRLTPFMRQVSFVDLKEDETNFQISFLSKESGIEKTKIEQLRDAFKQEHEFDSVPAWAFFGLAAQNIPLSNVISMSLDELVAALKPLQPNSDQHNLELVANSLKQFAQEHGIQTHITTLKTSVGELLQPILEAEKLSTFFDMYARHEGNTESFWQIMSQNETFKAYVPSIQLNLQLSQLTLNNKGLVNALQRTGIENTRQLVNISAQDWEALALENKTGIPLHITGENDQERAKIYAQELQTLVELTFPTDVIRKTIGHPAVKLFLDNNPDFDFTTTPVDTYLHEKPEAFKGIEQPEVAVVKTQLRQRQRIYTLTANTADMNVLIDKRYESAHQIAKLSPEDFILSVAGKISESNAITYHAQARAVSESIAMICQIVLDLTKSPNFQAVDNSSITWEKLFGSIDMCECQHCKSVYSPAAYFVDLLHVLLGYNDGAPRNEIFRRRPDLKYTTLSCEHTENLIPYIDLVNEILETYVAQSHVGDGEAGKYAETSTNDTSEFSASELAANPQHPNSNSDKDATAAYKLLKDAIYPLNLPFDMDLEVARQFLQEQNSSLFEVMKNFGDATSYATSAERLGISKREFEILTLKQLDGVLNARVNNDTRDLATIDLWSNTTRLHNIRYLRRLLADVNTFIENIAYTDLIDLLKTHFLNPEQDINLVSSNSETPCDLATTKIKHHNGELLNDEELSRFMSLFIRFIRLWKKLGCTITELDGLFVALGETDITPQVINDLSDLWQVQQDLNLSLDKVAVLIGNIPSIGKESLFARLFLNKAIMQIDKIFTLNVYQTELEITTESLKNHIPAILAALRISEEDFNQIAGYTKLIDEENTLNLANLSKIYRYVLFAKGLRMKIKDLITWLALGDQTPWNSVADLIKTKDFLEKINRYGFKASDFAYIFNNEIMAGNMLPPKAEIINQSAKTLREGLLKIRQENTPKDEIVTVDFLKMRLEMLLDSEEATKVVGILDGTNKENKFDYLLTLNTSALYGKDILEGYLVDPKTNTDNIKDLMSTIDIPARLKKYWNKIEAKLLPFLQTTFIQQHLTATFKAEAALVAFFLQDATILRICLDMDSETGTPAQAKAYRNLYILIYKCMWLIGKLKLSAKELSYFQNKDSFNKFNWKDLNFAAWLRIADFVAFRNTLPVAEKDLLSIFKTVPTFKKANNINDKTKATTKLRITNAITKAIIEVTGWDKADKDKDKKNNVEYFVSKHVVTDFRNEIPLIQLQKQIELSRRIGVSIEKLEWWASDSVTDEKAQDIKRSLKAKYDENAWIEVSTRVHNRLRTRLRDALVAYLLQKPEIKALGFIKDTNDLYGYFLIDVEMDACMRTSRLKQAIASVQLFVQRCLLNLESQNKSKIKSEQYQIILPSHIDANQWKWMKNYRVWEANRKVFLYPENWIEPELRDNKSPFFKELESQLLQGEVTNESVEKALINYLEKLHDVSRLDICGTYEDKEAHELHVFGRTFSSPPQYFYRKLDLQGQVWTAWERVQLDIQGNEEGESAGVHLIPVVWNRRLYLFWPVFTEKSDREKIKQDEEAHKIWEKRNKKIEDAKAKETQEYNSGGEGKSAVPLEIGAGEEPPIYPWAYHEVRIAWSEYRQNKWSNKKVSQSFIRTQSDENGVATYNYRFSVTIGSTLTIKLFDDQADPDNGLPDKDYDLLLGEYQLNCNGKVSALTLNWNSYSSIYVIDSEQVNFYQGFLSANKTSSGVINWHINKSSPLSLRDNNGKNNTQILSDSEEAYKLLFPADHDFSNNSSSKFIYQDQQRNYYVAPEAYFYEIFIPSLQSPEKSKISVPELKDTRPEGLRIDKGDPVAWFEGIKATDISQLVENKQIDVSTAMQVYSLQTLPAPAPVEMALKSLSFNAVNVGLAYSRSFVTKLRFKPFFHAHVCKLMEALEKEGIDGLLNLQNQQFSDLRFISTGEGLWGWTTTNNFKGIYRPNEDNVGTPDPLEDVDFSPAGAYSLYNWELFFHVPMLLANRLSKNQRFEESMRWYHFVFNPTTNDKLLSSARYWQVIPFRNTPKETLDQLFNQLKTTSDPNRKEFEDTITAWRNNPFNPHLIARMRLIAYQKNTVMKYLDNLIAWADNLFRQDTLESINEATQLYILAAELLGKRPEKIPARGEIKALNYAELDAKGINAFSNVLVEMETMFPFSNRQTIPQGVPGTSSIVNTTTSWYFCLPDNDKLLGYWDTVADRLFKIRHCQNIEGVERQLALFEPPIDPALLVQAMAGGVDISSVLADLNSPLPYYRFNYILQKALEICAELKSLGNSLLSALEKKDGEALAMMRTQHETLLLGLAKTVRKLQVTEAQYGKEGLEKTRAVTELRANFYTQLLKDGRSSSEKEHETLSFASMALSVMGQDLEMAASMAEPIPDEYVGGIAAGTTVGPISLKHLGGGTKGGATLSAFGRYFNMLSTMTSFAASSAQTNAGYERRAADWKLQQDLANKELIQIDKQIWATKFREQIADQELTNHEQQIENARQVEDFYRNKYTQEELYGWMIGEISTIYFQCYQLAYDLAKKAEKTYRYELGLPSSNFVQFGIWDSFRKGLMSGERLYLSLKQMEKSYMDQNRREYEITKNISLLLHDPLALITLKATGTCDLELPETLFDIDYPGHYMRRIKSVSISIPCVVGPYTGINCTLTLLSSKTRVKSVPQSPYTKSDDNRFVQNFSAMQSIATSNAQNDSGLFELNFRDERYLPFEGSGVISRWRIELPNEFRQFDYQTISDVILHLKYTARDGGKALRTEATGNLKTLLKQEETDKNYKLQSRLFSLRHEFPTEWYKLLSTANHSQTFSLNKQRFPMVFIDSVITVKKVDVFVSPKNGIKDLENITISNPDGTYNIKLSNTSNPDGTYIALQQATNVGELIYLTSASDLEVKDLGQNQNEADWKIEVIKPDIPEKLDDIFLLLHYIVEENEKKQGQL
ncbi:MAG: neuraminidase-like domain-containing protein [Methylococcales bacterium]